MMLRRVSDDDYVAKVRKNNLVLRRSQWAYPFAFILNAGAFYLVATNINLLVKFSEGSRLAAVGFLAGVIYAGVLLFVFVGTIGFLVQWTTIRRGNRTEKLLLKYYDELQERGSSNKAIDENGGEASPIRK